LAGGSGLAFPLVLLFLLLLCAVLARGPLGVLPQAWARLVQRPPTPAWLGPRPAALPAALTEAAAAAPPAAPWAPPPLTLDAVFGPPLDLRDADPRQVRVLLATGDVIPARSVNTAVLRRNDFLFPYRATADYLKAGDLLFIDLESPLLARCKPTDEGMTFCGDARNVEGLVYAGVSVAGLANNHSGNYGPAGTAETIALLRSHGIAPAGLGMIAYKTVRGLRFAFLAFNGVGQAVDRAELTRQITEAHAGADVVVVQFHWGKEYVRLPQPAPGVAPDDPRALGRLAVDAGADLVIGNHPHWVQGVELYRDRLITYAHGNFVFDQMFSAETKEGVVGRYTFYGPRLAAVEYRAVLIESWAQPRLAEGPAAARVLGQMEAASRALAALPPP
jgi:poly-gamma-glutamate synthesis protein (capsule biosynthesis protein)